MASTTIELSPFTFQRKKGMGSYTALQFARPVTKVLTRGKDKGKSVTKPDYSEFFALDAKTVRDLLRQHNVSEVKALVLGGSRCLRISAAKGGMVDEVIATLRKLKHGENITDAEKRTKVLAQDASSILTLYRAKNREKKSAKWTVDFCVKYFLAD